MLLPELHEGQPTVAPFRRAARPITRERLPDPPPREGLARIQWMRDLRYAVAVHGYRAACVLAGNGSSEDITCVLDDYRAWLLGEVADAVDFGFGLWLTVEGPAA